MEMGVEMDEHTLGMWHQWMRERCHTADQKAGADEIFALANIGLKVPAPRAEVEPKFIWCDNCETIQPLKRDALHGPDVKAEYTGAVDIMCGECRLVITTTYDKRLDMNSMPEEK